MIKVKEGSPKRQDHPEFEKYAYRPDEMWELLEKCWKQNPDDRPDIDEVVMELKKIGKKPEVGA